MTKSSVILLVGLAAAALMRGRSAALRHWVLASALACAAAIPALELVAPAWHLPAALQRLEARRAPLTLLLLVSGNDQRSGDSDPVETARNATPPASVDQWLWRGWITGAALGLLWLVLGMARLRRLAARSKALVGGPWADEAARLSRRLGLAPPLILQSSHPLLLVTWGLRRSRILLPAGAHGWPEDRAHAVLGHELAHIRRRDWAVQLLAEIFKAVYWFNPLFWVACRRLRQESERACDDEVLALGVQGTQYAGHLLELARGFERLRRSWPPVPAMARRPHLEGRIRAMLNARLDRTPLRRSACLATLVGLLGIAVPVAGLVGSPQGAAASFSGTLLDALNRPIPNVTLSVTDAGNGHRFDARSDQTGRFAFLALPAGNYDLEVANPGFMTVKTRLALSPGQSLQQDVALQLGRVQETIVITTAAPSAGAARPSARPRPQAPPRMDPCSQSNVGGCVTPPLKLTDVRPIYPAQLAASGVSGTVHVEGRIDTTGAVVDLQPKDGEDADFASATIEAVRQWKFAPTRLDGIPVDTQISVTARFDAK